MASQRDALKSIRTFPQLIKFLRDELEWPIESANFEELTFDYTAEELGIDSANAAKIQEIKRLRPLSTSQPWGIFFVKFEPKRLPVVALRRVLSRVVLKKRASANSAESKAWQANDLLFVSNYGEGAERQISFAHFSQDGEKADLPTLKVLGWDNRDTPLHLDDVADTLQQKLSWPGDDKNAKLWREQWSSAFTLRHREVITTSKELAIRLAVLARAIRSRIQTVLNIESDKGPLRKLMAAFQQSLIHDLTESDFADMYAQTIAYGLLSARITNPKHNTADAVTTHIPVTNPFLKELMETFLYLGGRKRKERGGSGIDFDELGVSEVVDLLDVANIEAVVRDFGDRNRDEDPVIHFYELFLKEYDPEKRAKRGVFYTPQPVVSYIVRSVHELLQTEFGLEDGLASTVTWGEMAAKHKELAIPVEAKHADPFVVILDPATGTGTFLVEIIDIIHKALTERWKQQRLNDVQQQAEWNKYVPKHLLPRLHGFELLMAPYAIAHMKIGLKLYETGYCFGSDERIRIYLTNALEPTGSGNKQMTFADWVPALAHEAQAVSEIKRMQRFTVVIGNPPYAGHSLNNQVEWIVDKVYDYKRGYPDLQKPGQAKWLQDDYVKFLRLAEWHVCQSNTGIVGFITNHAWLENPTFKGMRRHFLDNFHGLAVLDLHGNANRKEVSPDGTPDKNVFEIKQGVAISLLIRSSGGTGLVRRGDLLGSEAHKFAALGSGTFVSLLGSEFSPLAPEYVLVSLNNALKEEYEHFSSLPTIMDCNGDPAPGIVTTHDEFAISFSRREQIDKVNALLSTRNETQARELFALCTQNQWNYAEAKKALRTQDWLQDIVPILYRPFDQRVTVYNRHIAVHRRERVSRHMLSGNNIGISIPRSTEIKRGWEHVFCSSRLIQHHTVSIKEVNYLFPLWLEPEWPETRRLPNVSPERAAELGESIGLAWINGLEANENNKRSARWDGRGDLKHTFGPRDLFDWIYAVLHSRSYRARYAPFLKSDFARVPLAPGLELFRKLIPLGDELIALHLLESTKLEKNCVTFVGSPNQKVETVSYSKGTVWFDIAQDCGFHGVPETVWDFHIGGYPVCEKWLKDRKGRRLSKDDIAHYNKIVAALSETIRLMKKIDEVIDEHGGWPGAFVTGEKAASRKS
jgi:hypothetical protein